MNSRRDLLKSGALLAGGMLLSGAAPAPATTGPSSEPVPYIPVVTPNGTSLPWRRVDGVKEFRLIAEPVRREFAPGMVVNAWGYNGASPGPTIEAVQGDRVRIFVTNKLAEGTSVHWHGLRVPNGMDGVAGLTQPPIPPGRTMVYEFDLRDSGTFMYHPHANEMVQIAMGMMGFFIVHPSKAEAAPAPVDRDFAIMLHAWDIEPGTATPKPATMSDFNIWTLNSRIYPGTQPLAVRLGDRVRIRFANLSMEAHPMHLHGFHPRQTGTDGGWIPVGAQWPMTTMNVPVGTSAVMEFDADAPGDWALHCHRTHHTMNAMDHTAPNLIGVDQSGLDRRIQALLPDYMAMDMAAMGGMPMPLPPNTIPMQAGAGPFGPIQMGGMFTLVKVRDGLAAGDYRDPGPYRHPAGTLPRLI